MADYDQLGCYAHATSAELKQQNVARHKRWLVAAEQEAKFALENLQRAKRYYREALNADTSTGW